MAFSLQQRIDFEYQSVRKFASSSVVSANTALCHATRAGLLLLVEKPKHEKEFEDWIDATFGPEKAVTLRRWRTLPGKLGLDPKTFTLSGGLPDNETLKQLWIERNVSTLMQGYRATDMLPDSDSSTKTESSGQASQRPLIVIRINSENKNIREWSRSALLEYVEQAKPIVDDYNTALELLEAQA